MTNTYPQGCAQVVPKTAMWPFNKRPPDFSELHRKLIELELRLSDLESKHLSLRGRVYGAGIHKKPLADNDEARENTTPRSRDELRKLAGIKAGQPYPHKQ
jgi:hypothetical protein